MLKGIKDFKNLIELDLSSNRIASNIEELTSLIYLKKLNLSFNSVQELSILPPNLENLNLSNNMI